MLLVIAYPELSRADFELIENYREQNDVFFPVVRPHFTLVFPVEGIPLADFVGEVNNQLSGVSPCSFVLRCATINKDDLSDTYYTFLVPDEGFSNLVKMHDRLYSGLLASYHRYDIDFIPHVTIASTTDVAACKQKVDEWNATDFEIRGTINALDVINYDGGIVSTIERIQLDG